MDDERYVPALDELGLPDTSRYSGSESGIIAGASYERIGRRNEFRRRERLLDTLASGRVLLARLLPYAVLIFIAVMAWHYLAPGKWHWMSLEQIDRVETALAGGAVSLIILFLRRYL